MIGYVAGEESAMIQSFATAWFVGAIFALAIGFGVASLLGMIAIAAKWGSFSIGVGPLRFFEYSGRSGSTIFAVAFRGELLYLAIAVGLANGLATLLFA